MTWKRRVNGLLAVLLGIGLGLLLTGPVAVGTAAYASLSVSDAAITEEATAEFTVTLSRSLARKVTVTYTTEDGTAEAPDDYTPTQGALVFMPGETIRSISVSTGYDLLDENTESFRLVLLHSENALIADRSGVATISDDDPPATVQFDTVITSVTEGDAGFVQLRLTIYVNYGGSSSGKTIQVFYTTDDVSAKSPEDYLSEIGMVTLTPGTRSADISISVRGDVGPESNERFNVRLTAARNAEITEDVGRGRIIDDDL